MIRPRALSRCLRTLFQVNYQPAGQHQRRSRRLTAERTQTVRARYVVAADGANRFIRKSLGITFEDLGFQEDWLVIDVKPNEGVSLDVPDINQ
nr:FAD-dependent monooxygenase [Pararobbsia alpina]